MRDQASLLLRILREFVKQHALPTPGVIEVLLDCLEITNEEFLDIVDIRKADVREVFVATPFYGQINDLINNIDLSPYQSSEGRSEGKNDGT